MGKRVQTAEELALSQKRGDQLSRLRRVQRLAERAKTVSAQRDEAIRQALGICSIRETAKAADLSPARIHQIRHGK
jgi:hypothetical protein